MEAGGAQGAALRMSQDIRERGMESETWFLYTKRPIYSTEYATKTFLTHPPKSLRDYIVIITKASLALKLSNADGIITFTHYSNIIGCFLAQVSGIRHRLASQRNPSWSYPKIARYIDMAWGILGVYTNNVMVSESTLESFKHYPKAYIRTSRVIMNGINFKHTKLSKIEARIKLHLPQEVHIVGTLGRLAEQKNQQTLIEALVFMPLVHLVIAGDGELREQLESKAKELKVDERVSFLGEINTDSLSHFFNAMDIFCFPSLFEAFGFALLEAMSTGLPVIVSDIPALREVVSENGLYVNPLDPKAWSTSIEKTLSSTDLLSDLSIRSTSRSKEFSLEQMTSGYIKLLFKGKI
jgi:glycosyltransferase involved in cell wall biosynthesis